jgi:hypothetical protein
MIPYQRQPYDESLASAGARMQEHDQPGNVRHELLERLRALEAPSSQGGLTELSYRRAKEALERALEEARAIRLQAIEDARQTREREMRAMMESLQVLRHEAETQIDSLLRTAELEAERLHSNARAEAQQTLDAANAEAATLRAEAQAVRAAAEARAKEVERLESDFNEAANAIVQRLSGEKPSQGWFKR